MFKEARSDKTVEYEMDGNFQWSRSFIKVAWNIKLNQTNNFAYRKSAKC